MAVPRDGLAPRHPQSDRLRVGELDAMGAGTPSDARACPGGLWEEAVCSGQQLHRAPPGHAPALWRAILPEAFGTGHVAHTPTTTRPCGGTSPGPSVQANSYAVLHRQVDDGVGCAVLPWGALYRRYSPYPLSRRG
ncbi:MAG: hypothetical protein L3K26_17875 [Candidatus Hydrogenedentes bacterium]|nr:hypothetical protein [Candidatus Hydrogenedentota bacterium]